MRVQREKLPDLPVDRLQATENRPKVGVYRGCTVGYRCRECGQADEDIKEVLHEEECPLAGRHARAVYDDLPQHHLTVTNPRELEDRHPITLIIAEWTDRSADVWREDIIAFRCDECGNLDETLFEVVHDEVCALSSCGESSLREIVDALDVNVEPQSQCVSTAE